MKRPTRALLYVIICLAGSYFSNGSEGLCLWANPKYTRAAKGGAGDCKLGGWVKICTHWSVCDNYLIFAVGFCRNYGASLAAQDEAQEVGCQQVLWLYGDDQQITEAGTMNIFLHWINEDGGQTRYWVLVFWVFIITVSHRLDTVASLTSSGELWLIQQRSFKFLSFFL